MTLHDRMSEADCLALAHDRMIDWIRLTVVDGLADHGRDPVADTDLVELVVVRFAGSNVPGVHGRTATDVIQVMLARLILRARSHVLGFTAANDVSARDVQRGRFNNGTSTRPKARALTASHLWDHACARSRTLEPGDVILTGTPAGVGHPSGRLLRPGSVVRVEVEGVGAIENTVTTAA